jgi:hypothetical protein
VLNVYESVQGAGLGLWVPGVPPTLKLPSSAMTLCGFVPALCQVTVSPTRIETDVGLK